MKHHNPDPLHVRAGHRPKVVELPSGLDTLSDPALAMLAERITEKLGPLHDAITDERVLRLRRRMGKPDGAPTVLRLPDELNRLKAFLQELQPAARVVAVEVLDQELSPDLQRCAFEVGSYLSLLFDQLFARLMDLTDEAADKIIAARNN